MSAITIRPARRVLEGLFEGLAAGCGRHIPVHLKPCGGRQAAVRLVDRLDPCACILGRPPMRPAARRIAVARARKLMRR